MEVTSLHSGWMAISGLEMMRTSIQMLFEINQVLIAERLIIELIHCSHNKTLAAEN